MNTIGHWERLSHSVGTWMYRTNSCGGYLSRNYWMKDYTGVKTQINIYFRYVPLDNIVGLLHGLSKSSFGS